MDSFWVTLVVIAVAGLSNWLQQRAKSREELGQPRRAPTPPLRPRAQLPGQTASPPRPRSQPPQPSPLERELRRLLGEEVVLEPTHTPPVTPPPLHAPPHVPTASRQAPPPELAPEPKTLSSPGPLRESAAAYLRAQHLGEITTDRVHRADPVAQKPHLRSRSATPAAPGPGRVTLTALLHDRQAVRNAFIASLVFGSPKGMD